MKQLFLIVLYRLQNDTKVFCSVRGLFLFSSFLFALSIQHNTETETQKNVRNVYQEEYSIQNYSKKQKL